MTKMSLRDFVGKKRMIHDATHKVRVNHRIRCRDKIRAPDAREKKQLLRVSAAGIRATHHLLGGDGVQ